MKNFSSNYPVLSFFIGLSILILIVGIINKLFNPAAQGSSNLFAGLRSWGTRPIYPSSSYITRPSQPVTTLPTGTGPTILPIVQGAGCTVGGPCLDGNNNPGSFDSNCNCVKTMQSLSQQEANRECNSADRIRQYNERFGTNLTQLYAVPNGSGWTCSGAPAITRNPVYVQPVVLNPTPFPTPAPSPNPGPVGRGIQIPGTMRG